MAAAALLFWPDACCATRIISVNCLISEQGVTWKSRCSQNLPQRLVPPVQPLGELGAMELFLNFLWAMIALAALGTWRACWMHERRERRDPVREWAAVVCALVLLFFAVSLSDDLHTSIALLEEGAGNRRHSAVWD